MHHKKFEINQIKIKSGCQSGRKVVTHNSKSDLPLALKSRCTSIIYQQQVSPNPGPVPPQPSANGRQFAPQLPSKRRHHGRRRHILMHRRTVTNLTKFCLIFLNLIVNEQYLSFTTKINFFNISSFTLSLR